MKNKSTLSMIGLGIAAAFMLFLAWGFWMWFFCRFYVSPEHMAIITAKSGKPLAPGQILADPGQKGVQEAPLAEGRHFRNPVLYDWEIVPVIDIPAGKVGVVTAKVGKELPAGEFLADAGYKGIWRNVLGPGKYRLNPVGYDVEVMDALSIPIGYVGVLTSLSGKQTSPGAFAGSGEKGIRQDVLQPGLYYINPKEFKVDVLEIGLDQVSLTHHGASRVLTKGQLASQNEAIQQLDQNVIARQQEKRKVYLKKGGSLLGSSASLPRTSVRATTTAGRTRRDGAPGRQTQKREWFTGMPLAQSVEFPSRDGFEIQLDMTVEFELLPEHIAEIFRNFGDLPAVVDKIILPQILSVSRMKGSMYGAKDFIVGEGREKFQNDLKETLSTILGEKKIEVHNALIRHVTVPQEILDPIQQAALAVEQDLTNQERQNTARKEAELNTEEALVDQKRQEVMQETEKMVAEIEAETEKTVAETLADAERQMAEIAKETAQVQAEITRLRGETEAKVTQMVEGEKINGFALQVKALGGANAFTTLAFARELNPDIAVTILHAGQGTLWTDISRAQLGQLGGAVVLRQAQDSVKPGATGNPSATGTRVGGGTAGVRRFFHVPSAAVPAAVPAASNSGYKRGQGAQGAQGAQTGQGVRR